MLKRSAPNRNMCAITDPQSYPWYESSDNHPQLMPDMVRPDIFTHPNAQCTPESWDQRIPNEPIFERNFIIERPPIVSQDHPRNTSLCTPASHLNRPWLLTSHEIEKDAMMYWNRNTVNTKPQGVNGTPDKHTKSLKTMSEHHPDRPWLTSIRRNINMDSQLSARSYYNPKDCIHDDVQGDLLRLDRIADDALLHHMTGGGQRLDGNTRLWNQPTSMRMTEPIGFSYKRHVMKCYGKDVSNDMIH